MILISVQYKFFFMEQVFGSQLPTRNRQILEKRRKGREKFRVQEESYT